MTTLLSPLLAVTYWSPIYLSIMVGLILVGGLAAYLCSQDEGFGTHWFALASASFFLALVMVVGSFLESGPDEVRYVSILDPFAEVTPFRIILRVRPYPEVTWKEAETVKRIRDIAAVKITIPHSAWGASFDSEAKLTPVYDDDLDLPPALLARLLNARAGVSLPESPTPEITPR